MPQFISSPFSKDPRIPFIPIISHTFSPNALADSNFIIALAIPSELAHTLVLPPA